MRLGENTLHCLQTEPRLQKPNNPVTTFIIQNTRSEYFWNHLIQILFGVFRYKTL